MRFLVDADVPSQVCSDLRVAGHDAVHINEIGLAGGDGPALISRARDEGRVILSRNNDLEFQLFLADDPTTSVIVIRDDSPTEHLASFVLGAITPVLRDMLEAGAIAFISRDETSFRTLRR